MLRPAVVALAAAAAAAIAIACALEMSRDRPRAPRLLRRRLTVDVPTCTADEDLEYVQPILMCVPVDCMDKYGSDRGLFDDEVRL